MNSTSAANEFADVKLSPRARQTVGTFATTHLAGLRELTAGKPAPEIEGEDIGGKRFKLSEYRGKVVLLVFWASWCGPCMKQVPHELALVKRLEGRPFALLGVNIDRDRGKMESAISQHGITWRNWYDGGNGKIKARYNIQAIPLVLLLDPLGPSSPETLKARHWIELLILFSRSLQRISKRAERGTSKSSLIIPPSREQIHPIPNLRSETELEDLPSRFWG